MLHDILGRNREEIDLEALSGGAAPEGFVVLPKQPSWYQSHKKAVNYSTAGTVATVILLAAVFAYVNLGFGSGKNLSRASASNYSTPAKPNK